MVVATLAVSTAPILINLTNLAPASMSGYRLFGTALLLLPLGWRHRADLTTLTRAQWAKMLGAGVMFGLHFLLFIAAFRFTSFESVVILLAAQPVLAAVLGWMMLRERTTAAMWISALIAIVGIALLAWEDFAKDQLQNGVGLGHLFGDLLCLMAGVVVVLAIIWGRQVRPHVHFALYTSVVFATGGVVTLIAALIMNEDLLPADAESWGWLAALVFLPTLLGHTVFNFLVKHVRVFFINLVILAEPVLSILAKSLIDHPRLAEGDMTGWQIVGSGILIAGVTYGLVVRERTKPVPPPVPRE